MNELHLFAGDGGGILGGILGGDTPICAVEINKSCRETLLQRQRDCVLPWFPIWDDIKTFNGFEWRGIAQRVSGGFPCTDISSARTNSKHNGEQKGLGGESSGLWFEMERIVKEIQPEFVRIENSPNLRTKGLVRVLKGLGSMGYNAKWGVFQCRNFGADHIRRRLFISASNPSFSQCKRGGLSSRGDKKNSELGFPDWWKNQPGLERVANGMPRQMERLKAIGNRQVPIMAALAWQTLEIDL